ncbi:MAG TPA: glutathione S-transferase N-terminal domain-containing protein [Steroidobacteraceae bacterium]|nr:glutathione S-transferase N-terminal domain-containing protein [Steroidobacteraceae bacterium]
MNDRPMTRVYGVMSPNVLKVVIMLEELNQPYVLQHVALFKGEQFTPEFRALNPLSKVPVMEDPALETPLSESGAILIWLAERAHALLPEQSAERYEVLQWLMVQMSSIGPMLGQLTHFRLLPEGSEPYALGRYRTMAEKLYRLLDERLAQRSWIAGSGYSIADIAIFPWAEYLERHGFLAEQYPAMQRWRNVIDRRPAVIRAKARIFQAFSAPSAETMKSATSEDLDRFFGRTESMPARDFTAVKRLK